MAISDVARPLERVSASERVTYLQRVLLWTLGGLTVSGAVGLITAAVIYVGLSTAPGLFGNRFFMMAGILGSFAVAQYVAPRFVFGEKKVFGFALGVIFQGIAMGYLLLTAIIMTLGDVPWLIGAAVALTASTGLGMAAYVWTKPREFSFIKGFLSAAFIPMLLLMGVSFAFPSLFGGPLGILLSGVFVLVSAAGLLYQVNQVIHRLRTDMHIEGAYLITMGILVLFWNILTLLMRLTRR